MTQQRFYTSNALPTTLTASLGATGNPQVASITGLPTNYPFTVIVDWGNLSQEAVSVTSAPTGSGPFTLPCTRGIDGTSAQSHLLGAVAVHGVTAEDYTQWSAFIDSLTGTAASNFDALGSAAAAQAASGQLATVSSYTADQYFKSGRPWFDVAAFGADPTDTLDSTLPITRAINTAMGLRTDTGVAMTASSTAVTDSFAVSGDVGSYVNSPNFPLGCSLITAVTSSPVGYTVATPATASLSGQACGIGTGSAVTGRTPSGPVFMPSGTYKVSFDLLVQSVTGFQMLGAGAGTTVLKATGTGFTNAVLNIDGSLDGVFAGFAVQGDGTEGVSGGGGIPAAVSLTWTTSAQRSTSANTFRNLRIRNLNFISGLNLAGSGSRQTDGTTIHDVVIGGSQVKGGWTTAARADTGLCGTTSGSPTVTDTAAVAGDVLKPISGPGIPSGATITAVSGTTCTISANATATASSVTLTVGTSLWQYGFVFGNGTFGNDYDHQLYNCSVGHCYYGTYCNASGFGLWGSQPGANGCDFYVIPDGQVTIENVQSQNAGQFLLNAAGAGVAPCSVRDVFYSGFATPLASAGTTWVDVLGAGGSESWLFETVTNKSTYTTGSPVMAFNCSGGSTKEQVTLVNVRQNASPASGITVAGGGSVIAVNYIDTSTTPNTAYPLWLKNSAVTLASGITGATQPSRWAGATTSGAPTSGTFAAGDFVIDLTGRIWICATAGTPGTWVQAGIGVTVTGTPSSGKALIASSGTAASWAALTAIDGVTISGTPSSGQVLEASSSTAASWQSLSVTETNPQAGDAGYVAWTADPFCGSVTKSSTTIGVFQPSGAIAVSRMNIASTVSINGNLSFLWVQPTGGSPANSFVGLYNSSGTLLWTSADLTSTAGALQRIATGLTGVTAGDLYVASLIGTQGTTPGGLAMFAGGSTLGLAAAQVGTAPNRSSYLPGSATTLPSSLTYSSFTKSYYFVWAAID